VTLGGVIGATDKKKAAGAKAPAASLFTN